MSPVPFFAAWNNLFREVCSLEPLMKPRMQKTRQLPRHLPCGIRRYHTSRASDPARPLPTHGLSRSLEATALGRLCPWRCFAAGYAGVDLRNRIQRALDGFIASSEAVCNPIQHSFRRRVVRRDGSVGENANCIHVFPVQHIYLLSYFPWLFRCAESCTVDSYRCATSGSFGTPFTFLFLEPLYFVGLWMLCSDGCASFRGNTVVSPPHASRFRKRL